MGIPRVYRNTGEAPLVSYSQSDIATGRSRTDLFAGTIAILSGQTTARHILSNVKFYSNDVDAPAGTTQIQREFDLDFDLPQQIEGLTIIQVPAGFNKTGNGNLIVTTSLSKMIGGVSGTKLVIISGSCLKNFDSYTGGVQASGQTLAFDCPLTSFKTGDILRLYVDVTCDGLAKSLLAHDPMGRTSAYGFQTSQLIAQVPFKVDI